MAENLLVPSTVHFNMGSKAINITDYRIKLVISNDAKYVQSIDGKGKRSYALQKGQDISQNSDIKIELTKTPDGKYDGDIKKIEDALEDTNKNEPKKYVQDMLFSFATNDDTPFMNISFQGFVSELERDVDKDADLQKTVAELRIAEPTSFNIKK